MSKKEVFIAKNGRPYVKDENGKVKFISNTDWEQYMQKNQAKDDGRTLIIAVTIIGLAIVLANHLGWI